MNQQELEIVEVETLTDSDKLEKAQVKVHKNMDLDKLEKKVEKIADLIKLRKQKR